MCTGSLSFVAEFSIVERGCQQLNVATVARLTHDPVHVARCRHFADDGEVFQRDLLFSLYCAVNIPPASAERPQRAPKSTTIRRSPYSPWKLPCFIRFVRVCSRSSFLSSRFVRLWITMSHLVAPPPAVVCSNVVLQTPSQPAPAITRAQTVGCRPALLLRLPLDAYVLMLPSS